MKFIRLSLCILFVFISSASWAGRILPNDIYVMTLKDAFGKQVVLGTPKNAWLRTVTLGVVNGNKKYELSNGVRIRDDHNLFVTYNKLPKFRNRAIGVRVDRSNRIEEIWVLTAEERDRLLRSNHD